MSDDRAPLYERLKNYHANGYTSFHVPGHKSGQAGYLGAEQYYKGVLYLDQTEIPGLDDLHHPEGVILEAQRLAARCFGADETFFLVNGSTAGNLAMILATCRRNDLLLVQRDVHKSVLHGFMLAGVQAVFLSPRWCEKTQLSLGLDLNIVAEALKRYPQAKGLLVTNPSYYGVHADLRDIAKLMHSEGKVLLVDEAHGAHFGFHPDVPPSALSAGADAVVQSTHKMLTAMTMGAMLHVQGSRINKNAIRRALSIVQSSSPSYPIMASLDLCRKMMEENGKAQMEIGLRSVQYFLSKTNKCRRWEIVGRTADPQSMGCQNDPFKIIVKDASGKLDGFELKEQLEKRGCFPEMADPLHVLLVFSLSSTIQDADRLAQALFDIDSSVREVPLKKGKSEEVAPFATAISAPVSFDLQSVHHDVSDISLISLEQCAGHVAAEMIIPYPPGIPVLYPGEIISEQMAAYLLRLVNVGSRFHGYDVATQKNIPVFLKESLHTR